MPGVEVIDAGHRETVPRGILIIVTDGNQNSEFKATCLRLLERVHETGQPIEILKYEEPLAIVHAASPRTRKGAFGALKSTLRGHSGDLVEPIEGIEWEAIPK